MDKTEKKIQADIIKALKKIPGCVPFPHVASPYSPTGHPDIYGSIFGYSFWGEVKRPGNEATPIQQATLNLLAKASLYTNTFVWDNVEDAVEDINKLRKTMLKVRTKLFSRRKT